MSTSPVTKETVLPPSHPAPPSPTSSHAHLSPRLLTPDSTLGPSLDTLIFAKQPIPARKSHHKSTAIQPYFPFTESEASDGHSSEVYTPGGHSPTKPHHLSLLTAVLSSPDHTGPKSHKPRIEPVKASVLANAIVSGSSNPSTALSSPAAREPHGILQNTQQAPAVRPAETVPPSSILRRESVGTGDEQGVAAQAAGLGLGFTPGPKIGLPQEGPGGLDGLVKRLEKVEERRERIGWADKVEKVTPPLAHLARVPSAGSSIGPRPRLQFAVAHPPSHGSTSASEAGDAPARHHSSTNSSRRPSSPFAKERKVQESLDEQASDDEDEEEEEEDEDTPLEELPRMPGYNSRSTSSSGRRSEDLQSPIDEETDEDDLGYQEDEEDGMFSDEEETTAFELPGDLVKRKFAFARPTNYSRGRRPSREDVSPATTPPPAPAFFPPPNRRGRGHVRVADPILSVAQPEKKGCTRHCSPPPSSRSRSGSKVEQAPPAISSPSARFMKRPEALSVAGPSKQRIVGSPMPPRVFMADSDDEDEEEDDEEEEEKEADGEEEEGQDEDEEKRTPPVPRGGWRSDDSVFYGPNARVPSRAIRPFESHPHPHSRKFPVPLDSSAVFDDALSADDDQSVSASMAREASLEGPVGGVRHWIRRASELSGFGRPALAPEVRRASGDAASSGGGSAEGRSRDVLYTAPIPIQATVPPALDDTPIAACSFAKHTDTGNGLASRLEQTLSAATAGSPSSSTMSPAPTMSRETTHSSNTNTSLCPTPSTPSSRPVSSGNGAEPLNRAVSMSNRVTFRPTEKPIRAALPQRSVSAATQSFTCRKDSPGAGAGVGIAVAPIRCPKRVESRKEDLGWSDEALMSIRRKAGKGE